MNPVAQRENARTLAAAIRISESDAVELLNASIAVSFEPGDPLAADCAAQIQRMISRTITHVVMNPGREFRRFDVELVVGESGARFNIPRVFVGIGSERILIGQNRFSLSRGRVHRAGVLLGACYAVGTALKWALKDLLPFPTPEVLQVDLGEILGADLELLYRPVLFDEAYLAGAGAVGNGFADGLGCFDAIGKLWVADDDIVTDGSLQRCVLFEADDTGKPKATQLSKALEALLPKVTAIPLIARLQDVPGRFPGAWLKRLIVGVDSPRARRSLQSEIPAEVFDASTTGISEIVLHFNQQPSNIACMSCVYHESPEEDAHERHVAAALGVAIAEVKETRISPQAARRICQTYPQLEQAALVGIAYDTLFKQLCSTAQLAKSEDMQVLTPFAFVSVLAGTFLAIEFVRRVQRGHERLFNEWRLSPWSTPVMRRQRVLEKRPDCEFCGNPLLVSAADELWRCNGQQKIARAGIRDYRVPAGG